MQNLMDHAAFVNEQAAFHERQAIKYADEPKRATMHSSSAARFRALAADLAELIERDRIKAEREGQGTSIAWSEIEGLPDELIAELSISESDRADFNIMNLIEQSGGVASIDRLLIAMYKQSGEITKRSVITARLYRMANKGLIYAVAGKKGVYSIDPVEPDTAREAEPVARDLPSEIPGWMPRPRAIRLRVRPTNLRPTTDEEK